MTVNVGERKDGRKLEGSEVLDTYRAALVVEKPNIISDPIIRQSDLGA